ncbi:MAG: O-antigen ligase family protein [Acidobacteriota bacterium]
MDRSLPAAFAWAFTVLSVAFLSQIAVSEAFLGLALCAWLVDVLWRRDAGSLAVPDVVYPMGLYALLSAGAAVTSFDPGRSIVQLRECLLFGLVLLLVNLVRTRGDLAFLLGILMAMGTVLGVWGIVQYVELPKTILNRIHGPVGHYMTYSGMVLLIALCTVCHALSARSTRSRAALGLMAAIQVVALFLTLTRSAYIGFLVAATLWIAVRVPKLLLLLPAAIIATLAIAPQHVFNRVHTMGSRRDDTTLSRYYLWRGGIAMIHDYPFFGVGPHMVRTLYLERYRDPRTPTKSDSHLHDDVLQIAAERGIPALFAWLSIFAVLGFRAVRAWSRDPASPTKAAAVLALVAFQVAGVFEYNFGDSEVLLTFLVLASLPYVEDRLRSVPAPG